MGQAMHQAADRRVALAHQPFYGVLDLATGQHLTLHQFIGEGDYGDLVEKRRMALQHDLLEGNPRYVCQRCHKPMVLRAKPMPKLQENRFYLKHRYRSDICGGTKGMSHEAICAMVYAGAKESLAHKNYKALIEASLAADPSFSGTETEATWFEQDGVRWRKPDIQTRQSSRRIAMEVQLSTTFVEVIAQRQAFYRKNFGCLIWFFRDLDIGGFLQAEDDIFFNNNRNAFLITEETVALSQRERRLALKCTWQEPHLSGDTVTNIQRCQTIFFDQLQFDVKDGRIPRAWFFDYDTAREPLDAALEEQRPKPQELPYFDYSSPDALRDLMESFFRGYPNHVDNNEFWTLIRNRFNARGFTLPPYVRTDPIFPVLQAAYSAKLGRPVGCEQTYLIQVANTLFNSHKHALWTFSVMMNYYGRAALFRERGDMRAWAAKVQQYYQAWCDQDPTYQPRREFDDLVGFLFPEVDDAHREDPAAYVRRRLHS